MIRVWSSVVRKMPEMVLLLVFSTLLWVLGIPGGVNTGITAVVGVLLLIYDHEITLHYSARGARLARDFILEIAAVLSLSVALVLWGADAMTSGVLLAGACVVVAILNDTPVRTAYEVALRDVRAEPKRGALLLIALALMYIWDFSGETMLFMSLFLAFLTYRWDSRIPAGGALAALASCPVLLIAGFNDTAEQMAVYAYLLLVITVVLQIVEYWHEK